MDAMLVFLQLLILYIGTGDAVRCFECKDVPSPISCSDLTTCEKGEVNYAISMYHINTPGFNIYGCTESCYLEQMITTSGNVVYSSGCETNSRCASFRGPHAISRRSSGIVTCKECCDGMYCNNRGCGFKEIVRPDRGVYCYNCLYLTDPAVCNSVSICASTKKCITHVRDEFEGLRDETIYHSECMHKPSCKAFEVLGKGQCCDDDFCNDYFHISPFNTTGDKTTTATTIEHVYHTTNVRTDAHTSIPSSGVSNDPWKLPTTPTTEEFTNQVTSTTTRKFTNMSTNKPTNTTTGEFIMTFTNNTSSGASLSPTAEIPTQSATNEAIHVSRNVITEAFKTLSTKEFTVSTTESPIGTFINENTSGSSKNPTKTSTEASTVSTASESTPEGPRITTTKAPAISNPNKPTDTTTGVDTMAYTEESTNAQIKLTTDTPHHTLLNTSKQALSIASTSDPKETTAIVTDETDTHTQASTSEPNSIQAKVTGAYTHSPTNGPTVATENRTTETPTIASTSESANKPRNAVTTESSKNTADGAILSSSTNELRKSTTNPFSNKPTKASENEPKQATSYTSIETMFNKTTDAPTSYQTTLPTEVSSINPHASGKRCDTSGGYHRLTLSNSEQFCIKVFERDRGDWAHARTQCQKDHARLVVTDTDEKIRLTETLLRTSPGYRYMYWIGLWDRDGNDVFYWVNGARLTDADWGTNPPQPSLVFDGRDEDCVYIYNQDHWLDTWCDQSLGYICERT